MVCSGLTQHTTGAVKGFRKWLTIHALFTHTHTHTYTHEYIGTQHTHLMSCSCHHRVALSPVVVVNTKAHRHSVSAEPAEPLTNKHLGAIAQIVTGWKELGLQLQISSDDLGHILRMLKDVTTLAC